MRLQAIESQYYMPVFLNTGKGFENQEFVMLSAFCSTLRMDAGVLYQFASAFLRNFSKSAGFSLKAYEPARGTPFESTAT